MDIPPQNSLQIARQYSVICPAMNLHTAWGGLMHEPFSPFYPNGTKAERVVVLPAVLPNHEHISPAGRERWQWFHSNLSFMAAEAALLSIQHCSAMVANFDRPQSNGGGVWSSVHR